MHFFHKWKVIEQKWEVNSYGAHINALQECTKCKKQRKVITHAINTGKQDDM